MVLLVEGEMFFRDADGNHVKVECCGGDCENCVLTGPMMTFGRCSVFDTGMDKFVSLLREERAGKFYWYASLGINGKPVKRYVCVGDAIDGGKINKVIKKFSY